jgi:hypothetical protein
MFEFLAGVFASPFIWGPALILFFALEAYLVETDNGGKATIVLILTAIFLQAFTNFQPFSLIAQNPLWALILFVGYVLTGMLYTRYKWGAYVGRQHERITDYIDEAIRRDVGAYDATNPQHRAKMASYRKDAISLAIGYGKTLPIQISDNKARIMAWMSYWPASLAYTLFDDPIRRAFNYAYRRMSGALQRVSDRAHTDFERKYGEPKQPVAVPTPPGVDTSI